MLTLVLLDTEGFARTGELLRLFRWESIALAVVLWLLTNVIKATKKLHPILMILLSAVAGILLRLGGAS